MNFMRGFRVVVRLEGFNLGEKFKGFSSILREKRTGDFLDE